MATACTVHLNTGSQDTELGTSGVEFTEVNVDQDEIIFSAGSNSVKDGEAIPSDTQLTQAGVFLVEPRVDQTIDKYFLSDFSANELKQINNMGAGNYRYVVACDFDGLTASEPTLEIWDNSDLDSIDNVCLGGGVASSSWFRGVTTTDALPGVGWTGKRLAGSSDGYFLWLNNENGALSEADTLYFQIKIIIPSTQLEAGAEVPVFAIKFATAA